MPEGNRGYQMKLELTLRDRTLILDHAFAGPELTERLENALQKGTMLVVECTPDEIEELLGYLAFEANHTDSEKLERELDDLCDRLEEMRGNKQVMFRRQLEAIVSSLWEEEGHDEN
jgi:hypothetical protein